MELLSGAVGGQGGILSMVVMIGAMFVIMYFFVIRPQKKEQTRINDMLSALEVGDTIETTSGFYGVVIDMSEEDIVVEFGSNKNCRIPMRKQAVARVEKAE